ncbi:MAG TPA: ABC transporter, partial [Thermodesulfobacteriota bacterium]|nr:ABC transporter [Thermodesulfobacteriota bacterium]
FFLVTLALSFPIPLTLALLGGIDMGPIVGGSLGSCFLGAAYLSIGLFISSLAENQIVAFIIASLVSFVLFIIGEDIVLLSLPNALVAPFSYLGLGRHFASMQRGVLDSRDVLYYLTVIWFFLSLNTRLIASRRWS